MIELILMDRHLIDNLLVIDDDQQKIWKMCYVFDRKYRLCVMCLIET